MEAPPAKLFRALPSQMLDRLRKAGYAFGACSESVLARRLGLALSTNRRGPSIGSAVERLHGAPARWVESVAEGAVLWEGFVEVFALDSHPGGRARFRVGARDRRREAARRRGARQAPHQFPSRRGRRGVPTECGLLAVRQLKTAPGPVRDRGRPRRPGPDLPARIRPGEQEHVGDVGPDAL